MIMKQHEARIAELEDAVSRCLRHFRELVVEELAPSSWATKLSFKEWASIGHKENNSVLDYIDWDDATIVDDGGVT